ncbi:MAG: alpha/beta hydrolase [Brevundimonas sp.]|uniref:alpha/beta fold hydrolase n=1 Tax=Brevundimonas sp. TaxID=1871086 RepID=UPI0027365E24|nr:alpha/beta hydrolase [Brevundimonas sp.]MDP3377344.1 alpha/beta hydrolase [Brevundimonas sp.]
MKSLLLAAAVALMPLAACAQTPASVPADHGHAHSGFQSGRFHVRVEGEGRDIILIPGLSSHPDVWAPLVERLEGDWRVHMIHIQGFAGAPTMDNIDGPVAAPVAEDIARYIREQGLEDTVVIGHSMGGTIAMMLAARHPDLVDRLVVIDMIPFMGNMFGGPTATPASVTPIADQIGAGMAASTPEQWRASATTTIAGMIQTESLRAGPIEHSVTSDPGVAGRAMRELIVTDLRPELAAITAPTQVIYVAFNNPGMTPEITDGIYAASFANLKGVVLKRIDDSAHFIMLDQPVILADEVNDFLD